MSAPNYSRDIVTRSLTKCFMGLHLLVLKMIIVYQHLHTMGAVLVAVKGRYILLFANFVCRFGAMRGV